TASKTSTKRRILAPDLALYLLDPASRPQGRGQGTERHARGSVLRPGGREPGSRSGASCVSFTSIQEKDESKMKIPAEDFDFRRSAPVVFILISSLPPTISV